MALSEPVHKFPGASFTSTMQDNMDDRGTEPGRRKGEQRTEGKTLWLRLTTKGKEGIAGFFENLEPSVFQAPQLREDKV